MSISIDFTVRLIPVDLIDVASTMVRQGRHHDERYPNFQDLVASVAAVGILHPVIVREEGARYILISGKRRYYAAKAASLTMMPAMLCTLPNDQAWIVQMIETMHHQPFSDIDEGNVFWSAHIRQGMPIPLIARMINRSPSYVRHRLEVARNKILSEAVASTRISLETANVLRRLAAWFADAETSDDDGGVRYTLFHEPAALFEKLARDEKVSLAEANDLFDHYKRWQAPHSPEAYEAMVRQNRILYLPYLRYVAPAYYAQLCDDVERRLTERWRAEEKNRVESCAQNGDAYVAAPPPAPPVRPTVTTIAAYAPVPAAPPTTSARATPRTTPTAAATTSASPPAIPSLTRTFAQDIQEARASQAFAPNQPQRTPPRVDPVADLDRRDVPRVAFGRDPSLLVDGPPQPPVGDGRRPRSTPDEEPPETVLLRLLQALDTKALIAVEAIAHYMMRRTVSWVTLWSACRKAHAVRAQRS